MAQTPQKTCQPFSIPMAPVPCGPGYSGSKFPMKTMQCPSGVVTVGSTYDTSNCRPVGQTVDPNATNCSITPTVVGCIAPPTGQGCRPGTHWSLEGQGIAHCVNDDLNCPWGTSLIHDNLGNPSCVPNTCPSNQQLQSDGISCACPPSLSVWSGGVCSAPIVCPIPQLVTSACPSGYTGNQVSTTSFSGNACTPSTTVDTSGCIPPPTCPATSVTTGACPPGYTGNTVITTSYAVQGGSCVPNSIVDKSGCKSIENPTCPDGSPMPANGVCPVIPPTPTPITYVCAKDYHQDTANTKYVYEGFVSDPSDNQFDAGVANGSIILVTEFFNYTSAPAWSVSPYSPDADGNTSWWCQREGN